MNQPCNIPWFKDSKSSITELCRRAIGQHLTRDTDSSQVGAIAVTGSQSRLSWHIQYEYCDYHRKNSLIKLKDVKKLSCHGQTESL